MSTVTQRQHIATATQTYQDSGGASYAFWSLAPHTDFEAWQRRRLPKTREYAWLVRDQVAYEAIVDTATAQILVVSRSLNLIRKAA